MAPGPSMHADELEGTLEGTTACDITHDLVIVLDFSGGVLVDSLCLRGVSLRSVSLH